MSNTLSPEFQARLQAAMAALSPRDPRYRYWECRDCTAQFHYTTERMGDGKFASAAYLPRGKGSRSGDPQEWVLHQERHHNQRKAAKSRALHLFTVHRATHHKGDTTMPATATPNTTAVPAGTKTCPHCQVNKPTDDFSKDKYRKDGLSNWCRSCMKDYWTAKRAGTPAPAAAPKPEKAPKLQVVPPLPTDEQVETPEGQAALKANADAADRARKDAAAAKRREQRAAAKAKQDAANLADQAL